MVLRGGSMGDQLLIPYIPRMTMRNRCACGCGREVSGSDPDVVMIPDIGLISPECALPGVQEMLERSPVSIPTPFLP